MALQDDLSTTSELEIPDLVQPRRSRISLPSARHRELEKRRALITTDSRLISDKVIVQKMIELDYSSYRKGDPSAREVIDSIARVASEITDGFPIQFSGVGEDEKGLYPRFKTPDGEMPLYVLSQGTQSIIQSLGYLMLGYAQYYDFAKNFKDKPGVLIIDEIDAHLHPSWQQRTIPTLQKEFPNLQIFCSTHSPLMLAGLRAGQVHLLQRDEKGKVSVSTNEDDLLGWSSDEILRGMMRVKAPTDLETSARVERLKTLRAKQSLTTVEKRELNTLRLLIGEQLTGGPLEDELVELKKIVRGINGRKRRKYRKS